MIANPTTDELEGELGEQIHAERVRQNISQINLEKTAGVAVTALRRLEQGRGATVTTLVRVIRALGRLDWLASFRPAATTCIRRSEYVNEIDSYQTPWRP